MLYVGVYLRLFHSFSLRTTDFTLGVITIVCLSCLAVLGQFAVSKGGLLGKNVDAILSIGTICTAQEVARQTVILLRLDQSSR